MEPRFAFRADGFGEDPILSALFGSVSGLPAFKAPFSCYSLRLEYPLCFFVLLCLAVLLFPNCTDVALPDSFLVWWILSFGEVPFLVSDIVFWCGHVSYASATSR